MKEQLNLIFTGEYECPPTQSCKPSVRSSYIIHYVLSGRGYFFAGGRSYEISQGQAFLIYKGETVEYHAERTNPWHYVWVEFDGELSEKMLSKTGFSLKSRVTPLLDDCRVRDIFKSMKESFVGEISQLGSLSSFLALIAEIAKVFPGSGDNDSRVDLRERAIALIKRSYRSTECRVERIAELLGISRSRLFRILKEKFGFSPKEYIDKLRINHAASMLANTSVSIAEVAYTSGFSDPLYFSSSFRRKMGVSPSQYAKRVRGEEKQ